MPSAEDALLEIDLRNQEDATRTPDQPIAVVWRREGRTCHMMYTSSTVHKVKIALETDAEVDLLEGDWAIALYKYDKLIASGVSDLRDEAKNTMLEFESSPTSS